MLHIKGADGQTDLKSDGASGYFLGVQLPILPGLGMDSHKTKLNGDLKDVTRSSN